MCTILTVDYATFLDNRETIIARIKSDAIRNCDGYSLVMARKEGSLSLNSMDINTVVATIDAIDFERMWLHSRAATGMDTGVAYTHNFRTKDGLLIQHNGIVDNPDSLPVDSMRIAQLVDMLGLDHAIDFISSSGEMFFNTFFIEPEYGSYTVVRLSSGTLFMDGNGNYSTNPIDGLINIPVAGGHWESYPECIAKPQVVSSGNNWNSLYNRNDYLDNWSTVTPATKHDNKTISGSSSFDHYRWDTFWKKLDTGHYLAHPYEFEHDYLTAGEPDMTIADLDMVPAQCLDNVFCEPSKVKGKKVTYI